MPNDERLRVLMLSYEYPPNMVGGLGKHVNVLAPALAAQGVDVHLVTPRDGGGLSREQPASGVTVYRVDVPPSKMGALLSDTQLANWEMAQVGAGLYNTLGGFHVIHAHDWLVSYAALELKHKWKTPLVTTIHATERGRHRGELHSELSRVINDVEDHLCAESWRIVVTSYYMAHEIVTFFGEPYDKIDVISNGVSTDPYERYKDVDLTEYRRHFADDDEMIVFHVGRIVYEKGLHVLVEAAPLIVDQFPNVKFVIAGRGPMADELRLQAERQGVGSKFYFVGYIDDEERDRLYKVADVAVFPSLYEPFGIVALEAMAARVPVVVSGVGGLTEIVENHVTGIIAVPGNRESLAWAIVHTLARRDWAEARCNNAYRRIIESFTWERIATRTIETYRRVTAEREKTNW